MEKISFTFKFDGTESETVSAEYDTKYLINKDFSQIYPMDEKMHRYIMSGFNKRPNIKNDMKIGASSVSMYIDSDITFVFFNDGKSVKKPSIINTISELKNVNSIYALIFVPSVSKGCEEILKSMSSGIGCSYGIIRIKQLMTPEFAYSIPVMGRYANTSMGEIGKPKQTIVISVPSEGFPQIGKTGKLNASDIYDILKSKTGSGSDPKTESKAKGFDLILESFYDMLDLINAGKSINASKWNDILEKHNVIKFIENMEE